SSGFMLEINTRTPDTSLSDNEGVSTPGWTFLSHGIAPLFFAVTDFSGCTTSASAHTRIVHLSGESDMKTFSRLKR
ncbi:MAG: hypothetical protein JXA28_15040, partial [Bacteroidetes bacterium]|nr:hypothetical protein [Bacteroidota bacterium]